ncbi:MAG: hypothetical protein C0624_07880 [Desulfuromonas sp.]|nr:MAG: hypothetical protein C0624_07880 [Desulfuromonas sp.]
MKLSNLISTKIILPALLLGLQLGSWAHAETLNRIVAVVNDDVITSYELKQRLETVPQEQRDEAVGPLLEGMVEELLLKQRAKDLGISVSDEEIDAAVSDIQVQNRLTLEQLEQALQGQGQTLAGYRETLRSEILRYKLLGREVKAKADVTTQELRNYYEDHSTDYRLPPMVHLGVLNVALPAEVSVEGRKLLQGKCETLQEQLRKSDDFTALLDKVSQDPDVNGSDLGHFTEAELSPLFVEAINGLPVAGVSDVLEVTGGFALLKVLERSEGSMRPFEEVRDEIEKIVRENKTQELFEAWKKGLRAEALIDIRL